MHNVVSFQPDRPRPLRALNIPRSGARILFFTGVRYCRDEETGIDLQGYHGASPSPASGRVLDAAAH